MSTHLKVEPFADREWPPEHIDALFAASFPQFILADQEAKELIGPVRESFSAFEIGLVADEVPVAAGWGVPISWDGEVADLPNGYTDSLRRAIELREERGEANTFVICAGVVHPEHHGAGVATSLIEALVVMAEREGLTRVVAPLRPTLKHRYPLTDIAGYVAWTRPDGLPFDPWVRLHVRMGARILCPAPRSQVMTGTVAQWESLVDMALPATGDYVIPDGLSVLRIDIERDSGEYVEPNIWVRHR